MVTIHGNCAYSKFIIIIIIIIIQLGAVGLVAIAALSLHCCQLLIKCKYHAIQHIAGLRRHPNNFSLRARYTSAGRCRLSPSRLQLFTDHLTHAEGLAEGREGGTDSKAGGGSGAAAAGGRSLAVETPESRLVRSLQYGDLARMCLGRWGLPLTNALIVITQLGFCINYAIFTANAVLTFFPVYNCTVLLRNNSAVTSPDCQHLGNSPWQPWVEEQVNRSGRGGDLSEGGFVSFVEGVSQPPTASQSGRDAGTFSANLSLGNLSSPGESDFRTVMRDAASTPASQSKAYVKSPLPADSSAIQNSSASLGPNRSVSAGPMFTTTATNSTSTKDPAASVWDSSLPALPTDSALTSRSLTSTVTAPPSTNQSFPSTVTHPASANQNFNSTITSPAPTNQSSTSAITSPASTHQSSTPSSTPAITSPVSTNQSSTSARITSRPASTNQSSTSAITYPASTNDQSITSAITSPASTDDHSFASPTITPPIPTEWSKIWASAPDLRLMFLFPVGLYLILVLPRRLRGLGIISTVGNVGLLSGTAVILTSLIARKYQFQDRSLRSLVNQ